MPCGGPFLLVLCIYQRVIGHLLLSGVTVVESRPHTTDSHQGADVHVAKNSSVTVLSNTCPTSTQLRSDISGHGGMSL